MTENLPAEPVLQDKLSSHSPDASQQPTADQSLPPAHPHLKTHLQFLPYDERPLPAVHKQPVAAAVEPENGDTDVRGATAGEAEPLTEKALREAGSAVDALGEALVAGAYSKTWSFREDALLTLYKRLVETPVGTPKEDLKSALRASVFLIRRAIRDIVTPVSPAAPQGSLQCNAVTVPRRSQ